MKRASNVLHLIIIQKMFAASGSVCHAPWPTTWVFRPSHLEKKSLFDANARSHMGAEGIAQFIPSTAKLRGLKNVYNPVEALDKSAEYLAELNRRFGSLGMAAVAYNAGENRAAKYLADDPFMPYETQDYVMTITGQSVETWKQRPAMEVDYALIRGKAFMPHALTFVARKPITRFANRLSAAWAPLWGNGGTCQKELCPQNNSRQYKSNIKRF